MSGAFMPVEGPEKIVRDRFHRLANARENLSALVETRDWIEAMLAEQPADALADLENARTPAPRDAAPAPPWTAETLAFHAPVALLEGAWLQSVALVANNLDPAACELFSGYLTLLGRDASAAPACAYRGLLAGRRTLLPEVRAWRFAHDPRVGAPAMRRASPDLALGLHGARFLPEIVGYTLAYARDDAYTNLPGLEPQARRDILGELERRALSALSIWRRQGGDAARPGRGYALYRRAAEEYRRAFAEFAERPQSLAARVEAMLRRKRAFALGCHAGIELAGKPLEEWFAQDPFDGPGFLAAFAASPYAAGTSGMRLFERLTAFGGPMFGVFEREELALLDAWLNEGHAFGVCAKTAREPAAEQPCEPPRDIRAADSSIRAPAPADIRACFHGLVNEDLGIHETARRRVESVLARARRKLSRTGPLADRFFEYSPEALALRVEAVHREEAARRQPFQAPPRFGREIYAFGMRQFAPAILADGCWLQYLCEAADQDSLALRPLLRIYAEELGEGRPEWNHPKIYRDLLEKSGIALPPVDSLTFARHPEFLDAAFDLPVYLMAISRFPRTYLPELLGLNLAIELSGLGASYARLADELRYWGLDPLVVSLHQSIDTLAGGHAAMAVEAIQLHLDDSERQGGRAAAENAWRRIWIGRLSLQAATTRFKWAAILAGLWRFGPLRAVARHLSTASV